MRLVLSLLAAIGFVSLAGCSDRMIQNVYEGNRAVNNSGGFTPSDTRTPTERRDTTPQMPRYDQYEAERQRLKSGG